MCGEREKERNIRQEKQETELKFTDKVDATQRIYRKRLSNVMNLSRSTDDSLATASH